jgi:Raf kinase inhibitor-like YbhB/YbcL family protein
MPFAISSNAFQPSQTIPAKYTCDGANVSPDLKWSDPPSNTKSFALICDDPDAPVGNFTHWVLYGLATDTTELPEGLSKDAEVGSPRCKQGVTDFGKTGYGGPCPPKGKPHRYFFKLFALDFDLQLPPRASKGAVEQAMKGHILAEAELMGTYQRR